MAGQHLVPPSATTGQLSTCQCCSHEQCVPLKGHLWCRRWELLLWEVPRVVMPSEMLAELRTKLGDHDLKFYATHTVVDRMAKTGETRRATVFAILLSLCSDGKEPVVPGSTFEDFGKARGFNSGSTAMWHLGCCRDALEWDTKAWRRELRLRDGTLELGSFNVLYEFEISVRELTGEAPEWVV